MPVRCRRGPDPATTYGISGLPTPADASSGTRRRPPSNRAIAHYSETIRRDPTNVIAYGSRGLAYSAKGDLDRAITDYNEALRLNPKDATLHINRGDAYFDKGDLDRALADFNESIRLDP